MHKIRLFLITFISIISIGTLRTTRAEETVTTSDALAQNAKSAILIEVETGNILYEYNAHEKRSPASMTKIMTMKLVMDALNNKRISQEQILSTSEHASSMGGSQIFLSVNEQMSVNDLLKSMIIASANDAAVVLAEAIAGTEDNFVKNMNEEVKKLGLTNSHFQDVTGLSDDEHYSTCYDMAMMARSLLLNYEEEIIPFTSTYESYVRENTDKPFWLVNTNKLVKHISGVDGLKTGWTAKAGYCLTCTKKENGMRLISVVMGCDNVEARTKDTVALLNYGFANFEKAVLIEKGTQIETKDNLLYHPSKIVIETSSDLVFIKKKGIDIGQYTTDYKINHQAIAELKSQNIGQLILTFEDGTSLQISLDAKQTIERASFWEIILDVLKLIF